MEHQKRRKHIASALVRISCLIVGVAALLYPWISNYVYENRAQSEISTITSEADLLEDEAKNAYLAAAQEYNESLTQGQAKLIDPFVEEQETSTNYNELLAYSDSGIMGYIEIPAINVNLPVYHGTSNEVLEQGVGHLEGSSLPIGGESTHTVLTGHTGLSSAKLFTDLTELEIGDWFYITVLGDTMAYQVIDIQVVEPSDTAPLRIQEGYDLATLVTCTPYGINSHRLYVTGERGEYSEETYEEETKKNSDTGSLWMRKYRNALIVGVVTALITYFVVIWITRLYGKRKNRKGGV